MSINISDSFIRQFGDNIEAVAQQKASKLRMAVTEMRVRGKDFTVERLKNPNDTLNVVASRHADTVIQDMEHSRRVGFLTPYVSSYMIDDEDRVRMLVDPTSDYVAQIVAEMNRTIDDKILAALLGKANAGENGQTQVALPAGQQIAVGSSNKGLTLAKVKEAYTKLLANDVDVDREEMYLVTNAAGYNDLLNDAGLTSIDFVQFKPNMDAKVPVVAGFKVIHCERLTKYTGEATGDAPSSTSRPAIAFTKSAVRLGVAIDKIVDVSREPMKNLNHLITLKTMFGAVRAHDEKVVDIRFEE